MSGPTSNRPVNMLKMTIKSIRTHLQIVVRIDPGGRQVKGHIGTEIIAAYIASKSAIKCAYKHASSVGVMILEAWESQ